MKRKIKFRGKDVETGEWVYGDLLHVGGGCIITTNSELREPLPDGETALSYSKDEIAVVKRETVGQFTGLLDKNGKDIYEGDIMNDPTCMCVGVVEWNSILCQFQLSWQNMHTAADLFFMVKCGSFVIGNIHDNPELLKGGEE